MDKKVEWDDFAVKVSEYVGVESSDIKVDTNLYSDLGMDSLGLFSLGMYLTKTYKVTVPLSAVATIETVGDIYNIMNDHMKDV
ncbi:acyl carrier protein [Pseudobacteroides cellulosolvens]|uniref:Acyl carrier protein familyprotein n=1 Tax=Pseudobacteroides cellulosolvens ATCC 35603 = DSM 2933 TaxID=398512 RepID=A0A0L6JQR5_9FIRM|nr:acyl carrier protein [Pseudobacteroides cellulosolvens]KNY28040.1 acyl carrier protein familyprotein [Pseudobacteroides cellulosolvens ATCC 35603 = DSM 2933]